MRIHDLIRLSLQNVRRRSSRAVLTMLGIAIGIAVVFFLISLGYGLQRMLLMRITTEATLRTLDVASSSTEKLPLSRSAVVGFSKIPNVVTASPRSSESVSVRRGTLNSETTMRTVGEEYPELGGLSLQLGSFGSGKQVVISPTLAQLLGMSVEDSLGASLQVRYEPSDASGRDVAGDDAEILEPQPRTDTVTVSGVLDGTFLENEMYLLVDSAAQIPEPFELVKVSVDSSDDLAGVRDRLVSEGYLVSSLSDTADQANKVFRILRFILGIFGVFSLLVAAVGLLNTMTIAFLERTNDIGIMRAVGASRRNIRMMFLIESTLIGFAGGVVGIVVGYLATGLFSLILWIVSKSLGGSSISIFYTPPWFLVFILATSLAVGFMSGLFPARRAGNLNTLAALRYK